MSAAQEASLTKGWTDAGITPAPTNQQVLDFLRGDDEYKSQWTTDRRMTRREVLGQTHYCILCHEREKDSCAKGIPEKETGRFRKNPLGTPLTGCPLEERISEMHAAAREGDRAAVVGVQAVGRMHFFGGAVAGPHEQHVAGRHGAGVIGAGTMGNGIAQVFAATGRDVMLYEPDLGRADAGRERIAANLARRLAPRVTHLCLVSPAGFPLRRFGDRPTRSYREAGDDEKLFREICRHNLLVNMLSDPASITEETLDIQAECVRRARFNSRKVSGGGTLLGDLAQLTCRIRLLWGERDDSPFRPAHLLIGEIREAVGDLDLHRIPRAGHWSAYENAPEVNRLMLEFFES